MAVVEVPLALVWRLIAFAEATEKEPMASLALRLSARDLAEELRALPGLAAAR